ncbi:type IV pilus assembly protein PilW [Novimethylophilus kurashikiensis]|uniref:Type IV pilus assembly protein PilW n=2 Tax=Novimethylophilus kurashikiensis TaxID=1825523 RepID=A0A2R5F6H9_9PROT|nr:type IV pilus assembly protein PilW [Novimethylophilus kurashikiensis]
MKTCHLTRQTQTGLSLVELMVAITIGMLLVLGVTTVIVNTSAARSEQERAGRQIENGRFAIQTLSDDIKLAGFYDNYYNLSQPGTSDFSTAVPTLPDPCVSTSLSSLKAAMLLPIQGYDALPDSSNHAASSVYDALPSVTAAPECKTNVSSTLLPNYQAGTDILVTRRADTNVTSGALTATSWYIQTMPDNFVFNLGSNSATFTLTKKDSATAADIRQYLVHIYYISSKNAQNQSVPTLYMLELGTPPSSSSCISSGATAPCFYAVPIAEGIENLQLEYGIDNDQDGSPDTYVVSSPSTPMTTTQWAHTVTVKVGVLARNTDISPGNSDTKTYQLGSVTIPAANDQYKRHAFTSVVRVMNMSMRACIFSSNTNCKT